MLRRDFLGLAAGSVVSAWMPGAIAAGAAVPDGYRNLQIGKSTRLNSSHRCLSRMPSSA